MGYSEDELRSAFESGGGSYSDDELRSAFESGGGQYSEDELRSAFEQAQPQPDSSPGWLETLGTSATKGIGNVADGIAGLIKYGEDSLGLETGIGDDLLATQREYQKPREDLLAQVPRGSAQDYANKVTEGVTGVVPSLVSGAGIPGLAAQFGFTSLGREYAKRLGEGATPDQAENAAALAAVRDAALSAPVLSSAQASGPLLERMLFSGGVGSALGAVGGMAQPYIDSAATGEPVRPYNALQPMKEGAILGGLTGAAFPLASRAVDAVTAPRVDEATIEQALRNELTTTPPVEAPVSPQEPTGMKLPDLNPDPPINPQETSGMRLSDLSPEPQSPAPIEPQPLLELQPAPEAPAPPLPEPPSTITTTKVIEAPSNATKEFPDPLSATKVESKVASSEPLLQPETPPVSRNNWQKLKELAEPLQNVATRNDVQKLSPDQAWFEGRLFGRDVPGVSYALHKLRKNSMPRTISDRFPQVRDLYYKGGRALVEKQHEVAADLAETLRPYFKADNPELVDAVIGKAGELTKEQLRNGTTQPPQFSEQSLRNLGFTDNDLAAYGAYRQGMDQSLEVLRDTLKKQARKVQGDEKRGIYERDVDAYIDSLKGTNYFPARRYGKSLEVLAKNADGETTYRAHFDNINDARRSAAKLTHDPRYNRDKVSIAEIPMLDMNAYADLPGNLGAELSEFNPDKWTEAAKDRPAVGFTKHLIKAQKIPGYDKNIRKSTVDYVLGLSKFAAREESNAILDDLRSQIPEGTQLYSYLKNYQENQLTKPEGKTTKALLKLNNIMNLAMVPSSALVNTTQTLTTTIPKAAGELTRLYGARGPVELGIVNQRAVSQSFAYLADRLGGKVSKGVRAVTRKLDPELFADLDKASKVGVVDAEGMSELYNQKRIVEGNPSLADSMMFMFSAAEKANRLYAFTIGREIGKAKGMRGDQLFEYARDFTNTTQFDQSVANRSPAISSGFGRVATQYRPFQLNYFRFLRDNLHPKDLPVVGLSLAAMMGLGGAYALPFARDAERLAEGIGISPRRALRKFIGDDRWADSIMYGLPTQAGVSLSGAVSTGELVPQFDVDPGQALLKSLGPTADLFGNRIPKAMKQLTEKDNPLTALESLGPRFLRGPMKALRAAYAGKLEDSEGRTLLSDMQPEEIGALAIGGQPARLQREQEFLSEKYKLDQGAREKPKDYNTLIAQAVRNGDRGRAVELLKEVQTLNAALPPERRIEVSSNQIKKEIAALLDPRRGDLDKMPKKARPALVELMREYGKLP